MSYHEVYAMSLMTIRSILQEFNRTKAQSGEVHNMLKDLMIFNTLDALSILDDDDMTDEEVDAKVGKMKAQSLYQLNYHMQREMKRAGLIATERKPFLFDKQMRWKHEPK